MIAVEGVALGTLVDGRPADTPELVAEMAARFRPHTVPILSAHRGTLLGFVDVVWADGRDLRFMGSVSLGSHPELADRLRRGIPVSTETADGGTPTPERAAHASRFYDLHPHWRGRIELGPTNLIGIALSDQPAAPGSTVWIVPDGPPAAVFVARNEAGRLTRWTDLGWQAERSAIRPRDQHEGHHFTEEVRP